MSERGDHTHDPIWDRATVQERPFRSPVPLLGELIAGVRASWSSVAVRWLLRGVRGRQNGFNRLALRQLTHHDAWLLTQDREQTRQRRETAVLTTILNRQQQRLAALSTRLEKLEQESING